jgi:Ca2+-transporting ATPase
MGVKLIAQPHAASADAVLEALDVDPAHGLNDVQVSERLKTFGRNQLSKPAQASLLTLLLRQLRSPIVLLLAAAASFSFFTGEIAEFIAIAAVLVINTAIGFGTELQAVRSMQALREMTRVTCRVRRNSDLTELDAGQLVPGDILVLDAGDILAADARIFLLSNLACDESALTGESLPVSKSLDAV